MIQKLCNFAGAQSLAVKSGLNPDVVAMNDVWRPPLAPMTSDELALRELG